MKKRYLILAGILAAGMLAAGCGKKNSVAPEQKVEATATPTVTEAAKRMWWRCRPLLMKQQISRM